jgi:hypothetical protein
MYLTVTSENGQYFYTLRDQTFITSPRKEKNTHRCISPKNKTKTKTFNPKAKKQPTSQENLNLGPNISYQIF